MSLIRPTRRCICNLNESQVPGAQWCLSSALDLHWLIVRLNRRVWTSLVIECYVLHLIQTTSRTWMFGAKNEYEVKLPILVSWLLCCWEFSWLIFRGRPAAKTVSKCIETNVMRHRPSQEYFNSSVIVTSRGVQYVITARREMPV